MVETNNILKLLFCLSEGERIVEIEDAMGPCGCLIMSGDGTDLGGALEGTLHTLLDEFPDITEEDIYDMTGMRKKRRGLSEGICVDLGYVVHEIHKVNETPYTYLRWNAYMAYIQEQMLERGVDLCGLTILAAGVTRDFDLMDAVTEAVSITSFEDFLEVDYKDSILMRKYLDDRLFDAYIEEMGMPSRQQVKEKVRKLIEEGTLKTVKVDTGLYIRDDWDDVFRTEEDFVEMLLANRRYSNCLF